MIIPEWISKRLRFAGAADFIQNGETVFTIPDDCATLYIPKRSRLPKSKHPRL